MAFPGELGAPRPSVPNLCSEEDREAAQAPRRPGAAGGEEEQSGRTQACFLEPSALPPHPSVRTTRQAPGCPPSACHLHQHGLRKPEISPHCSPDFSCPHCQTLQAPPPVSSCLHSPAWRTGRQCQRLLWVLRHAPEGGEPRRRTTETQVFRSFQETGMDGAGERWPKACHFRALPPALVPAGPCPSPSLVCQGTCGTSRHSDLPRSVRHSGLVNRLARGSQAGRAGSCLPAAHLAQSSPQDRFRRMARPAPEISCRRGPRPHLQLWQQSLRILKMHNFTVHIQEGPRRDLQTGTRSRPKADRCLGTNHQTELADVRAASRGSGNAAPRLQPSLDQTKEHQWLGPTVCCPAHCPALGEAWASSWIHLGRLEESTFRC